MAVRVGTNAHNWPFACQHLAHNGSQPLCANIRCGNGSDNNMGQRGASCIRASLPIDAKNIIAAIFLMHAEFSSCMC